MNYERLMTELALPTYDGTNAQQAADILNAALEIDVASVTGQDIFEAVVPAEYNSLTSDQKILFSTIIGMGTIPVNSTNTKAALTGMFSAGMTRDNLAALQRTMASRATELGLPFIYAGHIENARAM